ncbi:MAG TPA: alcohol dehydrogenase catalytic domain-containing protein [Candidatus Sulfotelmatobacter sp.]|nr:alcohol dehydrogenase catalytic domain-containing protein [Candidatus Sulfotelmatobacter sp.]
MRALVKTRRGPGNVELQDWPEPKVGPREVLIEIAACGICGTDVHIYHDTVSSEPPVVLGHELSGVVVEVGAEVDHLKAGDAVSAETHHGLCGVCRYCRTGFPRHCRARGTIGRRVDGAFARYFKTDVARVYALPPGVNPLAGAITEPLFTCTHAVLERGEVRAGELAVVLGPGAMGLLAAQVARAAGATVVVAGLTADARRLGLARDLGIPHVVDLEAEDLEALVRGLTDGYGADLVLECSGAAPAAALAVRLLRKQGRLVQVGLVGSAVALPLDEITFNALDVRGAVGATATAKETALRLLAAGAVQTRPLVTHQYPLEAWREAFTRWEAREGVKHVLIPTG